MDTSKPNPKEQLSGSAGIKTTVPRWAKVCHVVGLGLIASPFFLAIIFGSVTIPLYPSTFELPISHLDTIALDQQGRIYTHSRWTNRIQVYGTQGRFVRGFSVDSGTFRISPQQIIRTDGWHKMRTYTLAGELLGEEPMDMVTFRKEFEDRPDDKVTDSDGNVYRVMPLQSFNPRVEKLSPNGDKEIVISQPLWMGLALWHSAGLIYFFCGLGLHATWLRVKRNCEKRLLDSQPGKD